MTTTPTSGAADLPDAMHMAELLENPINVVCQKTAAAVLRHQHSELERLHALAAGQATAAQPAPATQQVGEVRRAELVPGVMHCAKCKFQLNRVTLCVSDGNAYAGNNKTEPCPNGCGPLWPVTWEQEAKNCWKALEEMHERLMAAAAPKPVAREPLDEARRMFDAGWKAAALFCDREDVVADGIIGFGASPQFEAAFSAANGIKGGQHEHKQMD